MLGRIPKEIKADIGPLLDLLKERGCSISTSLYSAESFGNYYVDLYLGTVWFRIVRDRLQYFVEAKSPGDRLPEELNAAFDDRSSFERSLLAWLDAA
jgi:hypothetical protein